MRSIPSMTNPIPIWVADYVLISYGTGAIMAVPGHDTRDFEFAQEFEIDIIPVVDPGEAEEVSRDDVLAGKAVFTDLGIAVNSGEYDELPTNEFKARITEDLAQKAIGRSAVNYKLRDWLFSRQHFWGEPFPILHELDAEGNMTGLVRTVPAEELPVDLPTEMKFRLRTRQPRAATRRRAPGLAVRDRSTVKSTNGKRIRCPNGRAPAGTTCGSSTPKTPKPSSIPKSKRPGCPSTSTWVAPSTPCCTLLYARFWHKVLYDYGYVSGAEPFQKLVNQGMILGEMEFTGYKNQDEQWVSAGDVKTNAAGQQICKKTSEIVTPVKVAAEAVEKQGDAFVLKENAKMRVDSRAYKMSKSRGNVVNPDEVVKQYGADSLRLYEMFMGPLEAVKPWSMEGVSGVRGFLDRVWRMMVDERAEEVTLNAAIQDADRWPHRRAERRRRQANRRAP